MGNPPQTVCTALVALPQAAGAARTFTTSALEAWELSHLSDTAELLVSELITNAVKHAGGVVDPPDDLNELSGRIPPVILSLSVRDSLVVQVWDVSGTPPVRRAAADDDVSGRGLELVDLLSKEWGCEVLTTGGKIIWFALELDVCDIAE
jgi:hypothetical protein